MKEEQNSFYENIYEIVKLIPTGRVTTYGAIARALGASKSSRLVGMAIMAAHHPSTQLPIHRVVNRNGLLTGKHHYRGAKSMQELLELEGINIENDKVSNFKDIFWDPLIEL